MKKKFIIGFLLLLTAYLYSPTVQGAPPLNRDALNDLMTPGVDLSNWKTNLGQGYNMECVTTSQDRGVVTLRNIKEETQINARAVEGITYTSGNCSSSTSCHIAVCGQVLVQPPVGCGTQDTAFNTAHFGQPTRTLPIAYVGEETKSTFDPGVISNVRGRLIGAGDHISYAFFAASAATEDVVIANGGGGEEIATGNDSGLKNGQILFESVAGTPTTGAVRKKCVGVYWDPYGRVFDSISLEPLGKGDALVSVYDKNDVYLDIPSNNKAIDELGKYNIFLNKDGYYKLAVTGLTQHEFVKTPVDPKAVDLYETLYQKGDPAFEEKANNPQRYDVPVKPNNIPFQRPVETLFTDQKIIVDSGREYVLVNLRVTHPKIIIKTNAYSTDTFCAQTNSLYTDKDGFCTLLIPIAEYPQDGLKIQLIKDSRYYLYGEKVDGFGNINSKEIRHPMSTLVKNLNPILRAVEGYAYNEKGKIIPGALVRVILNLNGKIFTSVIADKNGFFSINKFNLPPLEFHLDFVDPTTLKITPQTTSDFIKTNNTYITDKKIDLMVTQKNGTPAKKIYRTASQQTEIIPNQEQKNAPSLNGISIQILIVILMLLTLLGIGIAFLILSKKNQSVA